MDSGDVDVNFAIVLNFKKRYNTSGCYVHSAGTVISDRFREVRV